MKFSVAPESSRATASALLDFECIKTCSIIDFRFDINTSWSRYHLIRADLIRHFENPVSFLRISLWTHPSDGSRVGQMMRGLRLGRFLEWGVVVGSSFLLVHRWYSWSWPFLELDIGLPDGWPYHSYSTFVKVSLFASLVWLAPHFHRPICCTSLGCKLNCSCPLGPVCCLSNVKHWMKSLVKV